MPNLRACASHPPNLRPLTRARPNVRLSTAPVQGRGRTGASSADRRTRRRRSGRDNRCCGRTARGSGPAPGRRSFGGRPGPVGTAAKRRRRPRARRNREIGTARTSRWGADPGPRSPVGAHRWGWRRVAGRPGPWWGAQGGAPQGPGSGLSVDPQVGSWGEARPRADSSVRRGRGRSGRRRGGAEVGRPRARLHGVQLPGRRSSPLGSPPGSHTWRGRTGRNLRGRTPIRKGRAATRSGRRPGPRGARSRPRRLRWRGYRPR